MRRMELSGVPAMLMLLRGMLLSGMVVRSMELRGIELSGIELSGIELSGMELSGLEARSEPLARMAWTSAARVLVGSTPRAPQLKVGSASSRNAHQSVAPSGTAIELRGMELRGVPAIAMLLSGIELSGIELRGMLLRGIELRGIELRGMELNGIEYRKMELSGVEDTSEPESRIAWTRS